MLQTKIKEDFTEKNPEKILEQIKKSIRKNKSANMTFDISMLNPIEASKIATLASTYHFLKFDNSKINWIVSSKEVEKMLKPMNLGNSKFLYI